ncbi:CD276 antigen-like [Xiphophorus hellerii]|uniref:CD276 antigen-like n=1 Tax=Xiphophorus hellerii TaxID=8084 RepID=UPI0013B390B9|nr:CD276 antigen-like [Xiphophorus hellerii]
MLPCRIELGSDPLIHWYQDSAGDVVVHSYYDGRDQLGYQNQNFQNRTSLFQDQISRGNASLLLKEVKIQDEGRYKCYTSIRTGYKELFINLKTEAPVSDIRIHQDGNRITCSSEGIYPQPELTWSTEPPSNTALNESTRIQKTEDQLYDISSSLTGPDEDNDVIYSCTVRTRSNNMIETYTIGRSHKEEDSPWWLIGGLVAAAVAGLIIGVVVGYLYERCKSKKSKNGSESDGKPENKDCEMDGDGCGRKCRMFPHKRKNPNISSIRPFYPPLNHRGPEGSWGQNPTVNGREAGSPGQVNGDRSTRKGHQERSPGQVTRKGHQDRSTWKGQPGQVNQDRSTWTGHQDRSTWTSQPGKVTRTGQPGQVNQDRSPGQVNLDRSTWTGQPGQVTRTGQPGKVNQDRLTWTDPEVSCVFRQSCMLPCRIQLGSDPLIHWYQDSAGDVLVHSYYEGRDQLGYQNQNFQNRTSLIQDQIYRGNASLLLKEVKIQDEGRYKCYTSIRTGYKELFINLKTEAPVSDIRIHQDGNRITCSSEGIYPQPELTWSTEPPSNTTLNESTRIQKTEDQLYDISSSLTVPDGSDWIYSCTIRTRSNNKTATLNKTGRSHKEKDSPWWLIGGLVAAAVAGLIIGVVVGCLCKRCKSKKSKSGPESQSASGGKPENKEETEMVLLNGNTEESDSKQELRQQENIEDSVIEEPRETDILETQK